MKFNHSPTTPPNNGQTEGETEERVDLDNAGLVDQETSSKEKHKQKEGAPLDHQA